MSLAGLLLTEFKYYQDKNRKRHATLERTSFARQLVHMPLPELLQYVGAPTEKSRESPVDRLLDDLVMSLHGFTRRAIHKATMIASRSDVVDDDFDIARSRCVATMRTCQAHLAQVSPRTALADKPPELPIMDCAMCATTLRLAIVVVLQETLDAFADRELLALMLSWCAELEAATSALGDSIKASLMTEVDDLQICSPVPSPIPSPFPSHLKIWAPKPQASRPSSSSSVDVFENIGFK